MKSAALFAVSLAWVQATSPAQSPERSYEEWLEECKRRVASYLLSLSEGDLQKNVSGVQSSDGALEWAKGKYLGELDFGSGVHVFRFAVKHDGTFYDVHYVWVDSGVERFNATRIACDGEWIEPGGFSSLDGEQWTSHYVEPGGEMLETWCKLN